METIILIHGLWMSGIVMLPQQRMLARRGFAVRRFSYPSMRQGLQHNARMLSQFVASTGNGNIHFVGHSLGGLVALAVAMPTLRLKLGEVLRFIKEAAL